MHIEPVRPWRGASGTGCHGTPTTHRDGTGHPASGARTYLRPSDEDLLAHVCLHFLVDRVRLFSRRALAQLADIAAILDTFADTLDWATLTSEAITRGYSGSLALALGAAAAVLDARLPDATLSALAPHSVGAPDVAEVVTRRVLRDASWTTLEQLTARQPSVRHLLPPNPRRWLPDVKESRPPFGILDGYTRWANASARILLRPGEVAAERRFADELQHLVFPRGLPNSTRPSSPTTLEEAQPQLEAGG